ncbi:hypothetical protein [Microcoleus sp. FACHB-672]|nr:hypothetical protein [Microcoleus sp. FACHB-672]MBD2039603.1 hypothetical protein [Microcoleus sp. FACHB-672]
MLTSPQGLVCQYTGGLQRWVIVAGIVRQGRIAFFEENLTTVKLLPNL